MRDNVVFEQKMMIERNSVNNNINYEGLKQVDGIADDLKLPELQGNKPRNFALQRGRLKARGGLGIGSAARNYASTPNIQAQYFTQRQPMRGLKTVFNRPANYSGSTKSFNPYKGLTRMNSYSNFTRAQKNPHELPDYLKNRITNNPRAITSMDHESLKDKGFSYQRRLQKAIFDRNDRYSALNSQMNSRRNSLTNHLLNSGGYRGRPQGYNRPGYAQRHKVGA